MGGNIKVIPNVSTRLIVIILIGGHFSCKTMRPATVPYVSRIGFEGKNQNSGMASTIPIPKYYRKHLGNIDAKGPYEQQKHNIIIRTENIDHRRVGQHSFERHTPPVRNYQNV